MKFLKSKRVILIILIILISLAGLKIITSQRQEEKEFVIGMSQVNLFEPWRINMNEEIKNEAKKYKNIRIVYKDSGGDPDKQKSDIKDLMNSGIDLLIVSIDDSQQLETMVSKAYGVMPVIVLGRAVEGYDCSLYISPDNEAIGRQAGDMVAELIGNKKGNVIEVQGLLNSPPVIGRSKGFKDVIKEHNNITISTTVIGEWQRDEAEDKVKEVLKEDNNVDVIFAHNDYMALGAYKAAHSLGLNNIKIIGVDGLTGENGGLDLVSKGILQGTFTCTTGGKEAIDYAVEILNKEVDIPKKLILSSVKITKENVNQH